MAEWSMAAVLKTVVRQRTGGSNPSSSAKKGSAFALLFCFGFGIRALRAHFSLYVTLTPNPSPRERGWPQKRPVVRRKGIFSLLPGGRGIYHYYIAGAAESRRRKRVCFLIACRRRNPGGMAQKMAQ